MKRIAVSPRLDGLLKANGRGLTERTVMGRYDSEKSYCANSDLLFLEDACHEKRSISPDEYKRQRESMISHIIRR